ncbi:MAG: ActD-like protein [Myxococcota bacterium]
MTPTPSVPDVLVERLALGELPPDKAEAVRARLEAAGELHRLEALQSDNVAVLTEYPPRVIAAAVETRASAQHRSSTTRWFAPAGLALVAALALFALNPFAIDPGNTVDPITDGVRYKGDASLFISRVEGGDPIRLTDGAAARAGDLIQVSYNAAGEAQYGAIVSVDGAGAVTSHHVGPLEPGTQAMSRLFQLDNAPRFEKFFLVLADEPVEIDIIVSVVSGGGTPEGTVFTFTLNKE